MITAAQALLTMETLPLRPVQTLLAAGRLLILAPHPDDESLGCGGLIAAACALGQPPLVVVATDGTGSHPHSAAYPAARLKPLREQEARDAVAELGLPPAQITFLGLTDTQSPTAGPAFDAAAADILALAKRHAIRTVVAPWAHDPHCDHESAHCLAAAVAVQSGLQHRAYPVWGWTLPAATRLPGPLPTGCRIDITPYLPAKRRAIAAHRSQYAGLIDDDPSGFQLPSAFTALFDRRFETYLDTP